MTPEQLEALERSRARQAGFTDEQIEAINRSRQSQGVGSQEERGWLESIGDLADDFTQATRSVANTATFGLGDKVAGAGQMLADYIFGPDDKDLEESYYQPKRERQQWERENPKTAFATGMTGAIINPASKSAGKWMAGGKTLPKIMGRSALGGSAWAGTQSLGESEGDLTERLKQTAIPMSYGAGFGLLIPPVLQAGSKGIGWLGNQTIGRFKALQQTAAERKLAEALMRDRTTPKKAQALLNKMGPQSAAMDIGPNTQGLTYQAYAVPGAGKSQIKDFLTRRQEGVLDPYKIRQGGQVQRIQNQIDELVPENYFSTKQAIDQSNKAAALYESAYKANPHIESKEVDLILKTPAGRKALKKAVELMRNDGKNVSKVDPELTAMLREQGEYTGKGVGRGLKLETLDYVKRALGDMETSATDKFGKATHESRVITGMRNRLTNALDKADETAKAGPNSYKKEGGDYAKARKLAGERFDEQAALKKGVDFLSKKEFPNPETMQQNLSKMSPKERHLFRVGVAQALKSKVDDIVVRGDATKQMMGKAALERKINLAFGNKEKFKKFMEMLEGEARMFETKTNVLSGSQTAERLAAIKEGTFDADQTLRGLQKVNLVRPLTWLQAGRDIASGISGKSGLGEITGPMSNRLAGLLTGRNVQEALRPSYVRSFNDDLTAKYFRDALIKGLSAEAGASELPLANQLRSGNKRR